MISRKFTFEPSKGRWQLGLMSLGYLALCVLFVFWFPRPKLSGLLGLLFAVTLLGAFYINTLGRDVLLFVFLVSRLVSRIFSYVALALIYVTGIGLLGSVIRWFGVDELRRDFSRCLKLRTMFTPVPPMGKEDFRRQS